MSLRAYGLVLLAACSASRTPLPPPAATLTPAPPPATAAAVASPAVPEPPSAVEPPGTVDACEASRHEDDAPARGFANDRSFTVVSAVLRSQARGTYPTMQLELGTTAKRFVEGPMAEYRGVDVRAFKNGSSFEIVPGTYPIPNAESQGVLWSAMMNVAGNIGTAMNDRGEVVIDAIDAGAGTTPPRARGHLWACFDSTSDFPGPMWIAGTFDAVIDLRDGLYNTPAAIHVTPGRIRLTRPTQR